MGRSVDQKHVESCKFRFKLVIGNSFFNLISKLQMK